MLLIKNIKLLVFFASFGNIWYSLPLFAQIVPDRTLGNESSIVTVQDNLADLIEGGAIRGDNLFHSFSEFNVSNGNQVYFANPDGIANILTRVTGNNISEIFGTLGVNGVANLFLLNPNGIVFGENAALDVNGSFLATTAESYIFENGFAYSASNFDAPPLLTINLPVGIQFGSTTGNIQVNGTGQKILTNADPLYISPWQRLSAPANLEVLSGNTLALIGGQVTLQGSSLRAEQGRIELGGVNSGIVGLESTPSGWKFDYSEVSSYQDINIQSFAAIDSGGTSSEGIQIVGKNIEITDGSVVLNQSLLNNTKTAIDIKAAETIKVSGTDSTSLIPSTLSITSLLNGNGELNITATDLIVEKGAGVGSIQFGNSLEGIDLNLTIERSILVEGFAPNNLSRFSRLGSLNLGNGNGGDVNILTQELQLNTGGFLGSTVAFSDGNGGDVNIIATNLVEIAGLIDGVGLVDNVSSAIDASNAGNGNAGSIDIKTAKLTIKDGGDIFSTSVAGSNAGSITINASEGVELSNLTDYYSSISSSVFANTDIQNLLGLPLIPNGNAGTVMINTPNLVAVGNTGIAVENEGTGQAGDLNVNANLISLSQDSRISATTVSGKGGNISLEVQDILSLNDRSQVSSNAGGTENGGNIIINSGLITILNTSLIDANGFQGNGGNIDITTQGLFISPNSLISASSEFGLDGTVEIERLNSDRAIELDALPQKPINATEQIIAGCSTDNNFIISGKGGLPNNPTQFLRSETVWQDLRLPEKNHTQVLSLSKNITNDNKLIEAQNWKINNRGKVELVARTSGDRFAYNNFNCWQ